MNIVCLGCRAKDDIIYDQEQRLLGIGGELEIMAAALEDTMARYDALAAKP